MNSGRWLAGLIAITNVIAHASVAIPVQVSVERAAREHLLAQATRAGLENIAVDVTVLPRHPHPAADICTEEVAIEPIETRSATRMRFAAVCRGAPGWRVEYVVSGRISADVVVAKAALPAGRAIGPEDLASERRDISSTPDATSDGGKIVGKSSRRPLRSGEVIAQHWLVDALLVKRGSVVSIVARQAGIEVQVAGEVLQPGHRDDIVSVRNTVTGKVIQARVISASTVEPRGLPAP